MGYRSLYFVSALGNQFRSWLSVPVRVFSRLESPGGVAIWRALGLSFSEGRFSMTRSTGFGLFAIIAALVAYITSLSFLSS
jgi:hypothetical protein